MFECFCVVAEQNGFYLWSSKLDVGATTTVELNAGQIFIHAPAVQYAESAFVDYWGDKITTIAGNVRQILKLTKGAKSKTVTIENIYNTAVRFYIFSLNFK